MQLYILQNLTIIDILKIIIIQFKFTNIVSNISVAIIDIVSIEVSLLTVDLVMSTFIFINYYY